MKISAGSPERQRKQLALLGLLVLTASVVFYVQFGRGTTVAGPGASNTPARTPARPGEAAASTGLPEALRLTALQPAEEAPRGARDPFGFGVPPRPAAPPVVQAPPRVAPPPAPRPQAAQTGRPAIPVKFLGFAEDPRRPGKWVSLSVNGTVVLAREGDIVDGRYRLEKVGLESITMTYLDGQGRQVIRQQGV